MKILLGLALSALTANVAWCGDLVITKQKHTDAHEIMGEKKAASDSTEVTWLGTDRMRLEDGDTITIVRADLKKMYVLDAKAKTYSALDLPVDLKKYVPAEYAPMMDMLVGQMKVTITPSEETKKVKDWDAKKVTMKITIPRGPAITQDMWVVQDVGVDVARWRDMMSTMMSSQPMGGGVASEMKKVEGFPVRIEKTQTMMGSDVKSTEEVVSIETKDAAADLYDVPKDFTEKPFDPMGEMRGPGPGGGRGRQR